MSHVDWISFTVEMPPFPIYTHEALGFVKDGLEKLETGIGSLATGDFVPQNGRAPYKASWHQEATGITIFTGNSLPHALIEISGSGCSKLGDVLCASILEAVRSRLTRMDIAVDMETDVSPVEFCEARTGAKFTSYSSLVSSTGETYYIGSRSSDRFVRVYRYAEPHPRAHLLRAEFQLKKHTARLVVDELLSRGVDSVASSLGLSFGFEHEAWNLRSSSEKIPAWRADRGEQKTILWLNAQVAPVLKRLHRTGEMDVESWIESILCQAELDALNEGEDL